MPDAHQEGLSRPEQQDAEDLAAPKAAVLHEVVRRQGEEELSRPPASLFWSGLAGGVTIMASVIAEAALQHKLPPGMPGREMIADLGYSLGFLMVILGRMQLFTEQTIVTVLPNMAKPSWRKFGLTVRLWLIVFLANMIGTCIAAGMNVHLHLVSEELMASMLEVSGSLLRKTPMEMLLQGIPAGFLIASVAWIRAGASNGEFWIVLSLTYAIALGDFTHVIAGSAEAFLLLFSGQVGIGHAVGGMILPSLAGNIIGGTGLFALLAHAQVRQEI
ncbi:formate/nitrite transporter family protein [Pseudoroseomonas ludipueritiae]|uniref:Formate/nitrite transporter family protein n=1 Tax=Pseudoroseomonas ludipueritiae TaxID=198093 RepID=A0ABR7R4P7_9PROT|nr:formate/nitrite transporter family protein [Pseudoroseomonas ludipueritiae]MBC9176693.1 formate/nitrite transporter family protein [Pseudoroseomonas ludipueritiae]MCG7360808.1 formate/nitrite transporter family protein [Roseomonas sp. ACRSG]